MVESGMKCVKYLLFAFNLVFVFAAIALIAVGIVVQTSFSGYLNFFNSPVTSVSILLIIVGVIMFFIAVFGCCGAIKENHMCTMVFAVLLTVIFIFQLAGGIAAFVMRNDLEKSVTETMTKAEINYLNSTGVQKTWDDVQTDFDCCGVKSYEEWQKVFRNNSLPLSCCSKDVKECNDSSSSLRDDPCATAFIDWAKSNLSKIAGAAIALAFIQILGIVFACCLARAIKKEYEVV